jgi:hypothetical protein
MADHIIRWAASVGAKVEITAPGSSRRDVLKRLK